VNTAWVLVVKFQDWVATTNPCVAPELEAEGGVQRLADYRLVNE
jgi:hypothetical protein